eukprot:scaffold49442_cov59-Phaeocystis_antarctica.AAC.4
MALSKLSGDEQCIISSQLCNVLDSRIAVAFSSANSELRALTHALLQQLRSDHEAAAALCRKLGMRSCKELREAKKVQVMGKGLTGAELALLGTLGSVLPALEELIFISIWCPLRTTHPDGLRRLFEGLGAGALPAMTELNLRAIHTGDAGASALAAALGRGALPRLKSLALSYTAIGDAGLVALAPALRRRPALEELNVSNNPFGDEGLAALAAPLPPAGAPSPPTGGLTNLKELYLHITQISDAGCATLAAAINSGALPALEKLGLQHIPASYAARAAVMARFAEPDTDYGSNTDDSDEDLEE